MKRTRTVFLTLVLIMAVLIMAGSCVTGPREGFKVYFEPIEVGATYSDERIAADGDNYYRFTPPSSGVYTISVTGADSDLSWELHDNAKDAWWLKERSIIAGKDSGGTIDEVGKTPLLTAGQEYYLVVFEWDEISGDYDLSITLSSYLPDEDYVAVVCIKNSSSNELDVSVSRSSTRVNIPPGGSCCFDVKLGTFVWANGYGHVFRYEGEVWEIW